MHLVLDGFEGYSDKVVHIVRFYGGAPYAKLAQLGEHLPYKQEVSSSSLLFRTIYGVVAQFGRAPRLHRGGRGFDACRLHHLSQGRPLRRRGGL